MLPGVNHCYWLWLHVSILLKSTDAETLICAGKWGRCPSVISSSHPGNSCELDLTSMKIISFVIIYILSKRCCWDVAPIEYVNPCKAKENLVSETWGPEQDQRSHSSNWSMCMSDKWGKSLFIADSHSSFSPYYKPFLLSVSVFFFLGWYATRRAVSVRGHGLLSLSVSRLSLKPAVNRLPFLIHLILQQQAFLMWGSLASITPYCTFVKPANCLSGTQFILFKSPEKRIENPLQCNSSYCCTLLNLHLWILWPKGSNASQFCVFADLHSFFSAVSWTFFKNSNTTKHALLDLLHIYGF